VFWLRPSAAATVSPQKLSFAYQRGTRPAPQTITVTGSSDAPVPQASASWLTIKRGSAASGKTDFVVQVLPDKLRPGTHTGVLTFAQNKKVPVELVVAEASLPTNAPEGRIEPASLLFHYSPTGVPPQKIVVSGLTPMLNPKPSERWVTATRRDLGPGKAEFLVQVADAGLAPGLHNAVLAFSDDRKVSIGFMIPGGSQTAVYPAVLKFPASAEGQKVTYIGTGEIPDPTPSEPWLHVSRAGASPGKVEFLVTTSTGDLDPGKYEASLTFEGDKTVRVELVVPPDPVTLEFKPNSLAFTDEGPAQVLLVTAAGDIPKPTVTDRWITFKRRDEGTGIAEFDVQVSAAGLKAGQHVGYLNFSPAQKVRIVLTVTAGAKR